MENHPIFASTVKVRMWISSCLVALMVFALMLTYVFLYTQGWIDITAVAAAVSGTASMLIGLSFAMSGFAYYFDFLDTKIAYRKYLGLLGYYSALIYCILLVIAEPDRYFYGFFSNFFSADFLLGFGAIGILTFMAVISNGWAMRDLGIYRWRRAMRFGYVAYGMLIVRAFVVEHTLWQSWISHTPLTLPPPRLLITLFALAVIGFRLSMMVNEWFRRRS